ncbi:MotE family protein [Paenibacillus sp. J5C2022]|uniref:MotE family protein n=1 Tax=Paenibacillus sp. J5C2022 TaxID=2977129 RepID=UPI0021CE08F0|nr:MgtE protein [Paenibacillus sp. J5C2022]
MKLADTGVEKGTSGFERFMFFTIPLLFVAVLLLVLLTIFDVDFRNRALQFGQSVPVLNNVLPEPKVAGNAMDDESIRTIKMTERIEELETEQASLTADLAKANEDKKTQEDIVAQLQGENAQLKRMVETEQLEDEQYGAKIGELASMFTKMTPSKAAPIIQNMQLEEMVLMFSYMRADDRVRIMEKMSPKVAADATVMLKDNVPVKDLQIAALQARLDKDGEGDNGASATKLDEEQLGATFAAMDPVSAAELLLKMREINATKVLRVLRSVNDGARSAILSAMSDQDEKVTAQIVSALMADA